MDQIFNVTLLHGHHLFWNELDVDLELTALNDPDRFPLISKASFHLPLPFGRSTVRVFVEVVLI